MTDRLRIRIGPWGKVRRFGRYIGAAYGDVVIGDYMTKAVFPSLLHQDPRYFRRGEGHKVQAGLCSEADLLYTHRFGRRTIQLLGNPRKFNCRGNFECILH